jgi:hypothetical protein
MTPTSIPMVPAQPAQANYSTAELDLVQTFTRDSYLAAFGVQAPVWDPTRVAKYWFDSTVDPTKVGSAAYTVVDVAAATLQQVTMPASEASTVNIPGAYVYPPYVIAPTDATRGGAPMNPSWFSLQSQAQALMTMFGGSNLLDAGITPVNPVIYPGDELRRMWTFTLTGVQINAGMLMVSEYSQGVGAPGQWDLSSGGPVWIAAPSAPTGLDDIRPPRPVPVRALLPGEQLIASPLGLGGVTVVRTDVSPELGGGYTVADRTLMQEIYNLVSKLSS